MIRTYTCSCANTYCVMVVEVNDYCYFLGKAKETHVIHGYEFPARPYMFLAHDYRCSMDHNHIYNEATIGPWQLF